MRLSTQRVSAFSVENDSLCWVLRTMNAANVVKRYFHGQVMYWCGWGWSNVAANAKRYEDLIDAERVCWDLPVDFGGKDSQADTIVLGPNLSRVFNSVGKSAY